MAIISSTVFLFLPFFVQADSKPPYGAEWYDTSEYLLGKVLVKVFFVESNGNIDPNLENWTAVEKEMARNAIEQATNWIKNQYDQEFPNAPAGAKLSFIIDYEDVSISYEPITRKGGPSGTPGGGGEETIWVQEIMNQKGFNNYPLSTHHNVADYMDDQRRVFGTEWAFAAFLVDNSNDNDCKFANGITYFAGGLGGPYVVLPNFYVGSAGPCPTAVNQAFRVISHEILHMFYALDEYSNYHYHEDARMGYLNGYNSNYLGAQGESCVMMASIYNCISQATKKIIGWYDSDSDDIPDILDLEPETDFSPYSSVNPSDNTPTFNGTAASQSLANQNPYQDGCSVTGDKSVILHLSPSPSYPWTRNNITINKITGVEYRVLQGASTIINWTSTQPSDGLFDYAAEDFTLTTAPLNNGAYTIETRAKNSVNLYDGSYAKNTFTIDTTPPAAPTGVMVN